MTNIESNEDNIKALGEVFEDKAKALGAVFAYLCQYSECNLLPYIETHSEPFNDVRPIGYDDAAELIPESERESLFYGPVTDPLGRALLASNGFNIDTLIQRATGATRAALEKWKTDNTLELQTVTVEDDIKNRPELMAMARRFAAMRISEMERDFCTKDEAAALELKKITAFDQSICTALYFAPINALKRAFEEIRAGKNVKMDELCKFLKDEGCIDDAEGWPEYLRMVIEGETRPATKRIWEGTGDQAKAFLDCLGGANYGRFNSYFHFKNIGKKMQTSQTYLFKSQEQEGKGLEKTPFSERLADFF